MSLENRFLNRRPWIPSVEAKKITAAANEERTPEINPIKNMKNIQKSPNN